MPGRIPLCIHETGEIFTSITALAEELGIHQSTLSRRRMGGILSADGFIIYEAPESKYFCRDCGAPLEKEDKKEVVGYICNLCVTQRDSGLKRKRRLSNLYNLSSEEYAKLYALQQGRCAICGKRETKKVKNTIQSLCVDHCHRTGKTRGLLCSACNRAIGLMGDDIETLTRAIQYLRGFKYAIAQKTA